MITPDEEIFKCHYPKLLIKDLKQSKRNNENNTWFLDLKHSINNKIFKKTIQFSTVQIQGILEQKISEDVMIIKDPTGKIKLTQCGKANGPKDNIMEGKRFIYVQKLLLIVIYLGTYCSVIGTLDNEKGVPEMSLMKIINLGENEQKSKILYDFWPTEVEDYQLYVIGALLPEFNTR